LNSEALNLLHTIIAASMTRLFLTFLGLTCFLSSCNDHLKIERNNDDQGYADSQFVGSWKITAVSADVAWDYDGNGTSETNIWATWTACAKDNLYTFVGDKTGTFRINCSLTKDGSWEVVNTKHLVYTPLNLGPESETIISMTSVQFKSTVAISLPNGQPATITKTWDRQ
jgi:hypothetical protein